MRCGEKCRLRRLGELNSLDRFVTARPVVLRSSDPLAEGLTPSLSRTGAAAHATARSTASIRVPAAGSAGGVCGQGAPRWPPWRDGGPFCAVGPGVADAAAASSRQWSVRGTRESSCPTLWCRLGAAPGGHGSGITCGLVWSWHHGSFAGIAAQCGRLRDPRALKRLHGSCDAADQRCIAESLLKLGRTGCSHQRPGEGGCSVQRHAGDQKLAGDWQTESCQGSGGQGYQRVNKRVCAGNDLKQLPLIVHAMQHFQKAVHGDT
jgi:hypothetical protein